MKAASTIVAAVLVVYACAVAGLATRVTPIQKVLEMLEGMSANAKKEKHEEQVKFAGFKQFCEDVTAEKEKAVETADKEIEIMEASVEKYSTDADSLADKI